MASYNFPIKMLKDELKQPFIPFVNAKSISMSSGWDLETEVWRRLTADDIVAGRNITIDKAGNRCTINGPAIMNNLTTASGGLGVLDAYQGKVLDDKIKNLSDKVDNNFSDTNDEINALKNRATSLEGRATALEDRATKLESRATSLESRATALENNKVDKRAGYDLSKNDFTDALLAKLNGIEAGAQVNTVLGVKGDAESDYRIGNINITKANIGLGNVENKSSATIRSELTSTNVTDALGYTPLDAALKGVPNGVAELDSNGHVPASQLPSYVDDVLEFDSESLFPRPGETGKIYVDTTTNLSYRWSGTMYIKIASALSLGETEDTAYRGDRGAAAYKHAVTNKGSAFASGFYKITTNGEGHVTSTITVQKSDITALGIPGQDTTYNDATQTEHGLMSVEDKKKLDNLHKVATSGSYNDLLNTPQDHVTWSNVANSDKVRIIISETKPENVPGYIDLWVNPNDETTYDDYVTEDELADAINTADKRYVHLTGNETIKGIKTFESIPVLPATNPTADNQAVRKAYVDAQISSSSSSGNSYADALVTNLEARVQDKLDVLTRADEQNVKLTGNQTVKGIKTFESIPVLPATNPATDNQATRKAYVDGLFKNCVVFDNRQTGDKVRVIVSTTKPNPADGYVDLWFNPNEAEVNALSIIATTADGETEEYELVNKKYVDDAIKAAVDDILDKVNIGG